jgi:hypothetical protein
MASTLYRHSQPGTGIRLVLLGFGSLACAITYWNLAGQGPVDPKGLLTAIATMVVMMGAIAWYFSSMTVEVTDQELRWTVGRGTPYAIPLSDIESMSIVRHPLWHGYGTRWLGSKRWAYIVSGREAVEVRLKSGGWRRIGTDDPQGLMAALGAATQADAPSA